jgi:catechol 2,3-dioxygenase-like lactoylglutathione lyase family enzyme
VGSRLIAVTYSTPDPALLARFWAVMLGREPVADADGVLLTGEDGQVGLRFVADGAPPRRPHRMHLHLASDNPGDQQRISATARAAGAVMLDVGQRPDEGHIVLADPGGYEFCVIEPGNRWLAGCGRLAEITAEGTRAAGFFWSEVLGWPLVWDQGEQTAVQSPGGGTKLSWDTWHSDPADGRAGAGRQRFELAADDLETEAGRLEGLGARRLGATLMADPDGTEFRVHG